MPNNHVIFLSGTITFTTSETRGTRRRVGFWQVPKPLASLGNRVGITAELPNRRHLWCSCYCNGRSHAHYCAHPSPPTPNTTQKLIAYESGVDPVGGDWAQSQIRYYVFAVLFVLFDVEAVFIFPWATRLEVYGTFGLVEMAIFIFILVLGLFYAWRKGVLRWV